MLSLTFRLRNCRTMSAKEIVAKLRAMAADPSHRTQLVKEPGTIPTLIMSLSDTDTDISFTALEVRP